MLVASSVLRFQSSRKTRANAPTVVSAQREIIVTLIAEWHYTVTLHTGRQQKTPKLATVSSILLLLFCQAPLGEECVAPNTDISLQSGQF